MGNSLPVGTIILGAQISVTEALVGPGLTSAKATIFSPPTDLVADLTLVDVYVTGRQQMILSVSLAGCYMDLLTAGALTAVVYYSVVSKDPYRLPPV
jgi:hypothetical protein